MTDDVWRELLQSPFDPDPPSDGEETDRRRPGMVRFGAVGLIVGIVVAAGWLMVSGDDATTTEGAVVGSATTTTVTPAAVAGLPAGYVEVAAGVGVKAELMYVQGDELHVVLGTAVASDVDPADAETFKGGEWVVLGGTAPVAATAEVGNPQSLGVITVRFPAGVVPPGSATALRLSPLAPRVEYEHEAHYDTDGLPFETEEPIRIAVDYGGAQVVVDRIAVGADVGVVEWHVEGPDTVRAQVDVVVELSGTGGGEADPATLLMSEHLAPPYPFQRPQKPTPSHAREGSDVLRRVGDAVEDGDIVESVVVRFTISVQDVLSMAPIEIPLEGAAIIRR